MNFSANDLDFLGFTFNGMHSLYDLNVYRVIDGSRITDNLAPTYSDLTADAPGGDGQYYFGTHHKTRVFPISFAFDSLTEAQLRKWKQFCRGKELSDLIFDEAPYKVYTAKITGTPQMKYVCFDAPDGSRIYKGEGTIEFTCYYPYAHTPNENTKVSTYLATDGIFGSDGRELSNYPDFVYKTKDQWSEASGLGTFVNGKNVGDIETHFTLSKDGVVLADTEFKVGELQVTLKEEA